jgi:hypothetical protein
VTNIHKILSRGLYLKGHMAFFQPELEKRLAFWGTYIYKGIHE